MSIAARLAKLEKNRLAACPGWDVIVLGDAEPEVPPVCSRCNRPNDHATILRFTEVIVTAEGVRGGEGESEAVEGIQC